MKERSKEELIKENQRLQDKLIENEKVFQLLIESTGNMITLHDKEGRYTYYKGPSTYSHIENQLIGKMPSDLFDEIESKKIMSGIQEAFNTGKTSLFESVLDLKGEQRTFSEKIYPISKNNKVIAAAKICCDITSIKKIEAEKLKNEEKLISITENASDHIILVDLDLKIQFINKTVPDLNKEDVLGKSIFDFTPKSYHNLVKEKFQLVLQSAEATTYQVEYLDKNNKTQYFDVRLSPIIENNKVISIVSSSNDISDRINSEKLLIESELRFRTIYENAPVLIDAFDKDGKCVLWNKQCEQTFGWTINELNTHENSLKLFYPDPEIQEEVFLSITTNPDGKFKEWNPLTKAGKKLTMMWANFKLPDGLTYSIGYDITERIVLEKEQRVSAERFERWKSSNFIGILHSTAKGDIIDANDTILDMIGYSKQDLTEGRVSWNKLTPPEFLGLDQKAMEEAAEKGSWTPFEKEYYHKDGHRVPILIGGSVFLETPDEYIVFIIDLTERVKIVKELKKHKNHLEELVVERTQELKEKNEALDESLKVFVGREQKIKILENQIIELKESIDAS